MAMKMTVKDWLNSLNREQLEKVCSLESDLLFYDFVKRSDMEDVAVNHFGTECLSAGVPVEYTKTAGALHNLAWEIKEYKAKLEASQRR